MAGTKSFITGLDLGKLVDPAAMSTAEIDASDKAKKYAIRHLQRWQLGSSYPQIVKEVCSLFDRPPLAGSTLVIDAGGVGRPVLDAFRAAKINAVLVPVTLTGGKRSNRGPNGWNVAKTDLVGALKMVLGSGRLKAAPQLPLTKALLREMETFTLTVNDNAHESFEAESGSHDDLLMSAAYIVWFGERVRPISPMRIYTFGQKRKQEMQRRIVVCGREKVKALELDEGLDCLVVNILDPGEELADAPMPVCKLLSRYTLSFADKQPAEIEGEWSGEDQAAMLGQAEAKRLWSWLNSPQFSRVGTPWHILAVIDKGEGDRRGLSVAQAVADAIGLRRENISRFDGAGDDAAGAAPNLHAYQTIKQARLCMAR